MNKDKLTQTLIKAKGGDTEAQLALYKHYDEAGDDANALKWITIPASQHNPHGVFHLFMNRKKYNLAVNIVRTLEKDLFNMADSGDDFIQLLLGLHLLYDDDVIDYADDIALEYMDDSAQQGNILAAQHLYEYYYERDYLKALEYAQVFPNFETD